MSRHKFDTTFDTPMRSNFAPTSYPRVMSRRNLHTTCTPPILAQQLSRRCTHAQTPRRNVMAYIRHLRGWRRAIMARALPWAGIPCSPCTMGTRPKILVGPIPTHRNDWFSCVWEWMEHGGLHISVYRKLPNVAGSGARRKPGESRHIEIIRFLEYAMAIIGDGDGDGDGGGDGRGRGRGDGGGRRDR